MEDKMKDTIRWGALAFGAVLIVAVILGIAFGGPSKAPVIVQKARPIELIVIHRECDFVELESQQFAICEDGTIWKATLSTRAVMEAEESPSE